MSLLGPSLTEAGFLCTSQGEGGVTSSVKAWGDAMLRFHGKDRSATRARDYTLSNLGYSTDNGAWMYYNPEKGKSYEASLMDVHQVPLLGLSCA